MPYPLTVLDGVRWQDGTVVGHRPRALLQALVDAGNGGCSDERLIEAVWGDDRPASPTKALQVLVSRIRAATDARVVERTERGYRLGLGRAEVDSLAQQDLVAAARSAYDQGSSDAAVAAARDALALGPCDDATTVLALASSHAGDHATALPLLEQRVLANPNDEEALACLLRSESSVRGPAAALERYESYRSGLADRLGSDPGPAVQAAHRELLAADRPTRAGVRYDGTTLLGRDADVRRLRALLHEARVVSIVGAGGLGKTRLAHVLGRETDRPVVHFVELVGVTSPDDVIGEIGSVLGIRDSVAARHALTPEQRADVRARIAQHLDVAPTLLILDNCEHVVDATADLVAFLVATTRDLCVVTTTRAPLNIGAERVYALEQLDTVDAVELFRQRATAARPKVVLDPAAVGAVVSRLDGLPLAIELAAAKVRVMSVEDIGNRLENRFALLRGGDRSAPDRHQTLLAVIDWSWNLLADRERRALRWLSVFHDGFTLGAAEAVLGADALDSLAELAHQSLLSVGEDGTGVRYRMLETVREFGRMQLVDAGEDADATRAQRAWACAYAETYLADLMSPAQFEAMDAIRAEEANLGDVLRQCLVEPEPDSLVVVLATLGTFWSVIGDHVRIIRLFAAIEEVLGDWTPPPERVESARVALSVVISNARIALPKLPRGLYRTLKSIGTDSEYPDVSAMCQVVLAQWNEDGDEDGAGEFPMLNLGDSAVLDELTESGDRNVTRIALQFRSHLRENDGYPDSAIEDARRALELCRDEDGPWYRAILGTQLAQLYAQVGQYEQAAEHTRRALPVLDRLEADDDAIQSRAILAIYAIRQGRYDDAEAVLEEIERSDRRTGFGSSAVIGTGRAQLALARGDVDTGLALCRVGIDSLRAVRFPGVRDFNGTEPWTLFGESTGLAAYALYGDGDDGDDLWNILRAKVMRVTDPERGHLDYPVVGAVLFALGAWAMLRETLPVRDAVRLLVLAERFGYSRMTPTMAWENVAAPAERIAPGVLDELQAEYGQRRGKELLGETRDLVGRLFG